MRLSNKIDRYPAKMVSHLADMLVERYATDAKRVLDPFCGSGAVLTAALKRHIPVAGLDINPLAGLFCNVKLKGFSAVKAHKLAIKVISKASTSKRLLSIDWPEKDYWFTPKTVEKYERLRAACSNLCLPDNDDGIAVLLSYALSVRLCSKADQRSPKPFISKRAIELRKGKHFDPYCAMLSILDELSIHYGTPNIDDNNSFILNDIANSSLSYSNIGKYSHVITSPPYINAQDYFRNFKLELYLLEGILPIKVSDIKSRFIGTERGDLLSGIPAHVITANFNRLPSLQRLQERNARSAAVIHRYLADMGTAFTNIKKCLIPEGKLILVCGDNLISGIRIPTWNILKKMLEDSGYELFDQFTDKIESRLLPPKRCGHKGLIKEEVICAFQLRD